MPVNAEDIRGLILLEVGDINPTTGEPPATPSAGLLYNQIELLWDRYAAKDQVTPGLRQLYVKRDCIRLILGVLAPRLFDASDVLAGFTFKANQIWGHYQEMHVCCKGEIQAVEAKFGGGPGYKAGRLTTRAPVTPLSPPDANAPRYGGSPYRGRRRRWG